MAGLKTCFKCGAEKPRTEFYKHPAMGDGLLGKCKDCTKRDVCEHRENNRERLIAYDKERSKLPHRKQNGAEHAKRWYQQYPERRYASTLVQRAIDAGKLIPQPCWVCGEKAEAHHPDYSRPLDVVWLCSSHHKQAHGIVKRSFV